MISIKPVLAAVALTAFGAVAAAAQDSTATHPWIARVNALGTSGTQLVGTVRITPAGKPNEYKAVAEMRGAKLGNEIPWSISTGQCGEPSPNELGARAQYRNMRASGDGQGRVNSNIKVELVDGQTYHVDFFATPMDRERVVSCGPLVPDR